MLHRSALTALVAVACLSTSAAAQSAQRWSIQASGLFVGVSGDAYEGLKSGPGGEVQLRLTPSLWSYGAGLQYSTHGIDGVADRNVELTGIFFEPRRVFDVGSAKVAPYVSARLAYLRLSLDLGEFGNEIGESSNERNTGSGPDVSLSAQQARANVVISASGFQGNVGGGVLVRLSPRVNLDLGATLGAIRFGEAKAEVDGETVETSGSSSGTGQNAVVRVGLAIGLGGGAKAKAAAPATRRR
ncbi:MAG: outer membrane beta-barrel protein [Gemmatimonadaceae bacterium]|nr:outer membrane beta-barrel protein [Gemmatimonadaceae bacterium]